jgi:mannose-6-phosphate isomerase-like protein (cupin superfamily)
LAYDRDDYCRIKAEYGPEVAVPLHSHAERETFFALSGELEGLLGTSWLTTKAGDVFEVPSVVRHAFRNQSGVTASILMVSTVGIARFSGGRQTAGKDGTKAAVARRPVEIWVVSQGAYWDCFRNGESS